jgi:hypothetical protein
MTPHGDPMRGDREAAWRRSEMTIGAAAALLREAGWTVLPPMPGALPAPAPGQVWVSPNPRIEPRTVLKIGTHHCYPWAGDQVVFFTTHRRGSPERPVPLCPERWRRWAENAEARPA